MRICYGIMAYQKEEQCKTLINLLNVNDNIVVVLIDKKSDKLFDDLKEEFKDEKNVHFVEDRINVEWGHISETEACVKLLEATLDYDFDYFTMMSEACLPLYSDKEIKAFLERHNGTEFIDVRFDWTKRSRLHLRHERPRTKWERKHRNILAFRDVFVDTFFGWAVKNNPQFKSFKVPTTLLWFTITKGLVEYMVKYIKDKNLLEKYKYTLMQDEHIFAEIVLDSPYYDKIQIKNVRGAALLWCDWYVISAPKVINMHDYKRLYSNKYPRLYARKFDKDRYPDVYNKVIENRLNDNFKCKYE